MIMEIDIRKNPYRGILSQVAKERGVTKQAVTAACKNRNYAVMKRISELVAERDAEIAKFPKLTLTAQS